MIIILCMMINDEVKICGYLTPGVSNLTDHGLVFLVQKIANFVSVLRSGIVQ